MLFSVEGYDTTRGGYPVWRGDHAIATFVEEAEARQYADYRNAMVKELGTTDVAAIPPLKSGGGVCTADPAQRPWPMTTPDASLPRFDPHIPRRKLLVTIEVPENWENRGDMQWCIEREINADRWSWSWPKPDLPLGPIADALLALDRIATRVEPEPDGYRECVNIARRVLREFPAEEYGRVMEAWREQSKPCGDGCRGCAYCRQESSAPPETPPPTCTEREKP